MKIASSFFCAALLSSAALSGCASSTPPGPDYAQQSFDELNAKIGYADAHIAYDPHSGCANYVATDPQGKPYVEPLRYSNGMTICMTDPMAEAGTS